MSEWSQLYEKDSEKEPYIRACTKAASDIDLLLSDGNASCTVVLTV